MATSANFTKFTDVSTIMNLVLPELGLANPGQYTTSQDQNVMQLLALLTGAGQDLCTMHDWQMLHKEWALTLVPGKTAYDLPEDWNDYVDDTMWNQTTRLPVVGPLTPQLWRLLKARLISGSTITLQYRIIGNQLVLYNVPTSATVLNADYYSRGWVRDAANPDIKRDNVQQDTDVLLFDSRLLVPFLKLKWRAAKKFDTTTELEEFNMAFELITGRDTPGITLSIAATTSYPYIGLGNVPDSGIGS